MFSPRPLAPALATAATAIAVATVTGIVLAAPGLAPAAAAAPTAAVTPAAMAVPSVEPFVEADTPLSVSISSLTPGVLPRSGPVRVSGTVTNNDEVAWEQIKVYAFASAAPMTTAAEVAEAVATDPTLEVGARITAPDTYDEIDVMEPGASATYRLTVPRDELAVTAPGVYWFGVHALGQTDEGRVPGADGRARTFLPLVESGVDRVPVSVVVPLRREVRYAADGSVTGVKGWARTLGAGGKLRERVAFGAAAGDRPISWLLDPALLDAARRLAAGNPPRSLSPTVAEDAPDPDDSASPDGAATEGSSGESETSSPTSEADGSPTATASADDGLLPEPEPDLGELEPTTAAAARAATGWLTRLETALDSQRVLALPYGDLDVPAAVKHAPDLLDRTRARSTEALADLTVPVVPTVAAPSGWLDAASLRAIEQSTLVLLTDEAVPAESFPDGVPTVLDRSRPPGRARLQCRGRRRPRPGRRPGSAGPAAADPGRGGAAHPRVRRPAAPAAGRRPAHLVAAGRAGQLPRRARAALDRPAVRRRRRRVGRSRGAAGGAGLPRPAGQARAGPAPLRHRRRAGLRRRRPAAAVAAQRPGRRRGHRPEPMRSPPTTRGCTPGWPDAPPNGPRPGSPNGSTR